MSFDRGTPATPNPAARPPPVRGLFTKDRAAFRLTALLAALVVIAVGLAAWLLRPSLPPQSETLAEPRELETLAEGRTFLDLPVMTLYAPAIPGAGSSSEVVFTMGGSFAIAYIWNPRLVEGVPVRFALAPSGEFEQDAENTVRLRLGVPGRSVTTAAGGPNGIKHVELAACEMTYVIKRMAVAQGIYSRTWLEVQYSLRSLGTHGGPLPYRNVSEPTSSDLVPAGLVTFETTGTWGFSRSVRGDASAAGLFGHLAGRFEFDAGSAGIVTAELTSRFIWGPEDDYRVVLRGTAAGVSEWYWDLRFGSLFVTFSPLP